MASTKRTLLHKAKRCNDMNVSFLFMTPVPVTYFLLHVLVSGFEEK